ncbi:MAG TPA: VWA domain-containing protein [Candidatus Limnocylindrales bacterium]|nr:VWA domain-containing protein [Candidatus Limnocylindrales bacterium]
MTFASPELLLALAAVPLALAAYLLVQRRRRRYAVRFTNVDLLANLAPRSPGWRRHVPPACYLLAIAALGLALARPSMTLPVPREEATVMLAIDTSGSMRADDVAPTRLAAAEQAAASFVDDLPDRFQVGLVAFSSNARIVVAPTTDRAVIHAGLGSLVADGGTAIGDAIEAALIAVGRSTARGGGSGNQPLAAPAPPSPTPLGDAAWPGDGRSRPPTAATVLLSDGDSTSGTPPPIAADEAAAAGVPVYTIALGTAAGTVDLPDDYGRIVRVSVPPDPDTLTDIAKRTGARFFDAPTSTDLSQVYETLGSKIGYTVEQQDVSQLFAAAALVLVILGGGLAALWFNRIP